VTNPQDTVGLWKSFLPLVQQMDWGGGWYKQNETQVREQCSPGGRKEASAGLLELSSLPESLFCDSGLLFLGWWSPIGAGCPCCEP
jgi:hypothetical protein